MERLEVPHFTVEERDRRWDRVRSLMIRGGLDVIVAFPQTSAWDYHNANVRYLTGVGGNCAPVGAVFPAHGDVTAITSPDVAPELWLGRQDWVTDIRTIGTGWGYAELILDRVRELGVDHGRIAVSGLAGNTRMPEGVLSHGMYLKLAEAFPHAELVNANPLMEAARFVKSDEEIDCLTRAVALVEGAVEVMCQEARPGVPECVVYARMLGHMVENGGELPTMLLWSAGWPQPPSNSYMPTQRPLAAGDMILGELEARWNGYVGQNTQPAFLGPVPPDYAEMFAIQQDAVQRCWDAMRPGATVGEIVEVARVAAEGTDYQSSLIMHGRGLGDDSPIAVFAAPNPVMRDWRIEENSAFIVKPVVATADRSKRIYWGDTVVVTLDGARRLGTRPPEVLSIG